MLTGEVEVVVNSSVVGTRHRREDLDSSLISPNPDWDKFQTGKAENVTNVTRTGEDAGKL